MGPSPYATVYAALVHQPQWYGVPVKIAIWNLIGMLAGLMLTFVILSNIWLNIVSALGIVVVAVSIHLVLRQSKDTDPDLCEVIVRFVIYPRYLGPR